MHDDPLGEMEKVLNYSIQFCAVVVHAFNLSTQEAEVKADL